MTYNTPELHLVGAAQNLVLEGSPKTGDKFTLAVEMQICEADTEDATGEDYEPRSSW